MSDGPISGSRRGERSAGREDRAASKAVSKEQQQAMDVLSGYWASAQGQAREAYERGDSLFELTAPAISTDRTVASMLFSGTGTKRVTAQVVGTLSAIEASGWHLEHVGYAYEHTGSVSRDMILSGGQVERVTGRVLGMYLFRRVPGDFVQMAPVHALAAVVRLEELTGTQTTRFPEIRNPEVAAAVRECLDTDAGE